MRVYIPRDMWVCKYIEVRRYSMYEICNCTYVVQYTYAQPKLPNYICVHNNDPWLKLNHMLLAPNNTYKGCSRFCVWALYPKPWGQLFGIPIKCVHVNVCTRDHTGPVCVCVTTAWELGYFILFYFILFYFILFYFILFYFILFFRVKIQYVEYCNSHVACEVGI